MKAIHTIKDVLLSYIIVGVSLFCGTVYGIEDPAAMTGVVGVAPHISQQVDLSTEFTDSAGNTGPLSNFMLPGRPTIILPVYYECPRLCGLLSTGVFDALTQVTLLMGTDYRLIFMSIDSREDSALAAKRKAERVKLLADKQIRDDQFTYLVGEADPIRKVMSTLGFHYKSDGEKDFAHTAVMMILTPQGKIAHYFLGIEFNPRDLRLAIVEASNGEVGTFVDQVLLYCFRFDPTKGKYTWVALNIMTAGGVVTLLALVAFFGTMWRRYRI